MEPRPNVPEPPGWRPPRALTPAEAGKVLKLAPATVRHLLRSGRLHGVEVTPRRWRTSEAAIQRFLDGEMGR
jgi:excisionase family DNA binding protein